MCLHEHDVDVVAGWDEAQDIFDLSVKLVVDKEHIESRVRERRLSDGVRFPHVTLLLGRRCRPCRPTEGHVGDSKRRQMAKLRMSNRISRGSDINSILDYLFALFMNVLDVDLSI